MSVRAILQFLYREGHLSENYSFLALSARQRSNEVKRFLPPEDIDRLLNSINRDTVKGKRNYLFFILMARLGLRGQEILRLKIEFIDWEKSRLFIDGKHQRETTLPFSNEVGQALLDYLKHSRRLDSEHLIVSFKPPFRALTRHYKFGEELREMYSKSGVKCPTKKVQISVFRHSLATGMLNSGSSMMEVKNLMRHESINTTMIYAKYNLESLSNLAFEWPEAAQ